MENAQKEWEKYARKVVLNNLYEIKVNKKIIDFLKNYNLTEINVMNRNPEEFNMEILFKTNNDIKKIIAEFELRDCRFYWTVPYELNILGIEGILDNFDFQSFVE